MTVKITQESDPLLWTLLHNSYVADGQPGNVTRGTKLYKVHSMQTEEIFFVEVSTIEYLDSRSIKKSKKATYKNLDK